VQVKTLPNKLVLASLDTGLPLSRVSVVLRAGSRYETADSQGVSSVLRSSAGLSTSGASTFAIVRNLQQLGGSLSVTADRETLAYTLEATSENIEQAFPFLVDAVTKQVFKPWEIEDNIPRIKYELAAVPPEARVLDLVNNAAYRSGLGNSVFVKEYNIGKISTETLQYFVGQTFTAPRAAVAGVGVSLEVLNRLADSLGLGTSPGPEEPAKYYGGEVRLDQPSAFSYVALAAEASGLKSKEALAFTVLRYALGAGPHIKYGVGAGPLGKLAAASKEPLGVSAFSSAYSDSGLFGVLVSTTARNAKAAVEGAAQALLSGSVTDADVARGKALAKVALLASYESGEGVVADLGNQAALLGSVLAAPQIVTAVDGVTTADVQSAAKKIASGKKSLASFGNVAYVPYLDQIAK